MLKNMKWIFVICFLAIQAIMVTESRRSKQKQNEIEACKDNPKHCDFYWSRGWFTCNNGAALWTFCPKSCGYCKKKECKDRRKSCEILARDGYCKAQKRYMSVYCTRSCKFCVDEPRPKLEPGCRDYEPMCPKWTSYGECSKSHDVRRFCPKSCGICGGKIKPTKKAKWKRCKDIRPSLCKNKYNCITRQNVIRDNCMKSCSMCKRDGSCYDKEPLCFWYKSSGYCKKSSQYYNFMKNKCRFSCSLCQ